METHKIWKFRHFGNQNRFFLLINFSFLNQEGSIHKNETKKGHIGTPTQIVIFGIFSHQIAEYT